MRKNKITVIPGTASLTGRRQGRCPHLSSEAAPTARPTQVKAKNVLLATGSDASMLPGLKADDTILTNYEILKIADASRSRWW